MVPSVSEREGMCCKECYVVCASRPGQPPADLIRQREMKWVEMTSHWEKTMSRRYKKVRKEGAVYWSPQLLIRPASASLAGPWPMKSCKRGWP